MARLHMCIPMILAYRLCEDGLATIRFPPTMSLQAATQRQTTSGLCHQLNLVHGGQAIGSTSKPQFAGNAGVAQAQTGIKWKVALTLRSGQACFGQLSRAFCKSCIVMKGEASAWPQPPLVNVEVPLVEVLCWLTALQFRRKNAD
jgi:hypothetical protein